MQQLAELNVDDERNGLELERNERWAEAVAHYQSVLARDASLTFAQPGLTRSSVRAEMASRFDEFISRPERLAAAAVRSSAEGLLGRSRNVTRPAPLLDTQVARLETLLARLDIEARVEISSDNSTRVTIARIGDLGAFTSRELTLRPGKYTIIGTRTGFRDVRREFSIEPGQRELSLSVQCTERI